MVRRRISMPLLGLAAILLSAPTLAADLPHPMHVPPKITGPARGELLGWRSALASEMDELGKRIDAQQAKCRAVDSRDTALIAACRAEIRELQQAHAAYFKALAAYTDRLKALLANPEEPQPPTVASADAQTIAAPPPGTPFAPRAAELMAALQTIAAWAIYEQGPLPHGTPADADDLQDRNCQAFFRALGEQLARQGRPSWNHQFPLKQYGKTDSPRAHEIFHAIAAEARAGGRWRELTPAQAQAAANRGAVVIGGVPARKAGASGHLAVVIPLPPGMDLSQFQKETVRGQPATAGTGPFVRDGNEHVFHKNQPDQRYELSTLGAIPASRMMRPADTRYFLWVASAPE
jgi:hypothetical protein